MRSRVMIMKNTARIGILGIFLACAALLPVRAGEPTTDSGPLQLRVLSYNIHHGEGVDKSLDIERIADVIKSVKPDVVALQEVDRGVKRTQGMDQPGELSKLTGLEVVFGNNIRYQGGDYGNAVLSRLPIKRHENHPLPALRDGEQRGVMEVEIELPGSKASLLFFATHFDYHPDESERLASVKFINELPVFDKQPLALLAGDLNALPESKTLQLLASSWKRANEQVQSTFPAEKPVRQIDYILARPKSRWKTVEFRVLDEPVASDHRPVFTVLELAPSPK